MTPDSGTKSMDSSPKIEVRRPRPEELETYYHLRWLTLREPKGLPPGSELDELDGTDEVRDLAVFVQPFSKQALRVSNIGFAASKSHEAPDSGTGWKMVGVGRLQLMKPMAERQTVHDPPGSVAATDFGTLRVARARLMGVHPQWRRRGIGRALLESVMEAAREWDCVKVTADARLEALDYYLACGFQMVSNEYYIKDIGPHHRVERRVREVEGQGLVEVDENGTHFV